jgi:PPOX class probable F420-dependent enzyme
MLFDPTTESGARIQKRLEQDKIIWLTTVAADGTPQPNPVWFLWDGESFLFYSQPAARRLKNIARSSRVSLNLEAGPWGDDVLVITGEARLDPAAPPWHQFPGAREKYEEGAKMLGQTLEQLASSFTVTYRVYPERIRGG